MKAFSATAIILQGLQRSKSVHLALADHLAYMTASAAASNGGLLTPNERVTELAPGKEALAAISHAAESGDSISFGLTAWQALTDIANLSWQLSSIPIAATLAQQTLDEMLVASRLSAGRWVAGRSQVPPLKQLLWVFDVQLQLCSRGELDGAKARVRNMARQALAGHAPPGVLVHEAAAPVAQERRQR